MIKLYFYLFDYKIFCFYFTSLVINYLSNSNINLTAVIKLVFLLSHLLYSVLISKISTHNNFRSGMINVLSKKASTQILRRKFQNDIQKIYDFIPSAIPTLKFHAKNMIYLLCGLF